MKFGTRDFHTMLLLLSTVIFSKIRAAMVALFLRAWMKLTPLQALTTLGRLMPEVECWICDALCPCSHRRRHSGAETWRGDTYHEWCVWFVFYCLLLTFWRWNYFLNFSAPCILNVNKTGTKYVRIMKQTAFWREKNGEYIPCLKYSVPIFVE